MPASFHFPHQEKSAAASLGEGLEVYKPLGYDPGDLKVHMGDFNYWTTARLRPGVLPARAQAELERYLATAGVEIVPVRAEHAAIACDAYRRYGKGRHPAGLNFGDVFAYALAKATGEPLLFKGQDFAQTDLPVVPDPTAPAGPSPAGRSSEAG